MSDSQVYKVHTLTAIILDTVHQSRGNIIWVIHHLCCAYLASYHGENRTSYPLNNGEALSICVSEMKNSRLYYYTWNTQLKLMEKQINLRSFKSSDHINEIRDGPYRDFGYLSLFIDPSDLAKWSQREIL